MKYVNLTPRWQEILPTWRRVVENMNSCKRNHRSHYNKDMGAFWDQMETAAKGADNFNDLVAYLRSPAEGWRDDEIVNALKHGREIQEQERTTVRETSDAS